MRIKITDEQRLIIIQRASFRCEYCLVHSNDFFLSGEVDHIISIKHGGTNDLNNLAFSCIHCNRNKGSDIATLLDHQLTPLFNPRKEIWPEHFKLDGPVISPVSLIGQATINLLQLNHELRIIERTVFIRQGSYPPYQIH